MGIMVMMGVPGGGLYGAAAVDRRQGVMSFFRPTHDLFPALTDLMTVVEDEGDAYILESGSDKSELASLAGLTDFSKEFEDAMFGEAVLFFLGLTEEAFDGEVGLSSVSL